MERKIYIDVIKGIAMILVVMQHTGGNIDEGIRLICKLDVPLFFLCSGFLAYRQHIDISKKIKSCLRRILIPFILACAFASIYFGESLESIFLSSGKRGYWFLEALFIIYFLFWAIYRRTTSIIIGGIIIELILLILSKYGNNTIDSVLGISYLSRYFPCFIAGALIKKLQIENLDKISVKCILLICSIIGLGINFTSTNISFLAHVVGYFTGSILVFYIIKDCISESASKHPISRTLAYVGRYSLNIYIIHFYLVRYLNINSVGFALDFAMVFTISAIITSLSIAIGKILTHCTPLNRVLTP